jgi:HSP90 family molecular chaperone
MTRIKWEDEATDEFLEALHEYRNSTSGEMYDSLREKGLTPVTSRRRIRQLAVKYSKRFNIPIKISAKAIDRDAEDALATYNYHYDKQGKLRATIYVHPVLGYYPETFVRGVIEHEIDHMHVEKRWSKIL